MPANNIAAPPAKKVAIPPMAIVILLVVAAGAGGFFYLNRAASLPPGAPPALTKEARDYVHNLKLSNVQMEANTSYLGQQVVEITGGVENAGDRNMSLVEINCVFYDAYGQLVLRKRVPVITRAMGGLATRQAKQFRLPFDDIPEGWNQALPQLVIAQIQFQ